MATRQWVCDICHQHDMAKPWICPGCKRETCERCFSAFAHCRECSAGKSNIELMKAANAAGWDFDLVINSGT